MTWKKSLLRSCSIVIAICGSSCALLDPFGPGFPMVGTLLVDDAFVVRPAWTASSEEIVFSFGPPYEMRAVRVPQGGKRVLNAVPIDGVAEHWIHIPNGSQTAYAAISGRSGFDEIHSFPIAGGTATRVASDLRWFVFDVTEDGTAVAYPQGRGALPDVDVFLVVKDIATGEVTEIEAGVDPPPYWEPFSFSPDGSKLLYCCPEGGIRVHDRVTGTTESWPGLTVPQERSLGHDVRWVGGEPHVLMAETRDEASPIEIFVFNGTSGAKTPMVTLPEGRSVPTLMAWSADRQRAAFWVVVDIDGSCSDGVCVGTPAFHSKLFLWSAGDGFEALVDLETRGPTWLAFSPDGRFVGYSLHGSLYVSKVP